MEIWNVQPLLITHYFLCCADHKRGRFNNIHLTPCEGEVDSLMNCFVWGRGGRGFVLGLGMRFGEV